MRLHVALAPDGWRVSAILRELGVAYQVHCIGLKAGHPHQPGFLTPKLSGRIPPIADDAADDIAIFESGTALIDLVQGYGGLLPGPLAERYGGLQWLMFQRGGVGPLLGRVNVFLGYRPNRIPDVIDCDQHGSPARACGVGQAAGGARLSQYQELDSANLAASGRKLAVE